MNYNQDIWRAIEEKVAEAVKGAVAGVIAGSGDDLPASAAKVGQLFLKTGTTNPGLYVSTGTTTPGWKAVDHAA